MIHIEDKNVREMLGSMGLNAVEDFLAYKNDFCYKINHFRAVYKIECKNAKNIFLKKYHRLPLKMFLNMLFAKKISEGRKELDNIQYVMRKGIRSIVPVGYGERSIWNIPIQSFLLTYSMEHLPRLEDVVAKNWTKFDLSKRNTITAELAKIVYTLHSDNMFHKDLYLGHFLFEECGDKVPSLYLIDLQRIKKHNIRLKRWRIKDLASLNYSADLCGVPVKDRIRFLKKYCIMMGEEYRKYIAPICRKTEIIKKHTMKLYFKKNLKKKQRRKA